MFFVFFLYREYIREFNCFLHSSQAAFYTPLSLIAYSKIFCSVDLPWFANNITIDARLVPAHQHNAAHRLAADIKETAEPSQSTEGANCGNNWVSYDRMAVLGIHILYVSSKYIFELFR